MKPKLLSVTASELVILAVHELESTRLPNLGPTFPEIVELICKKYKVNNADLKGDIREALLRGVTFGIFDEKDGHYRLEEVPDPPLELKVSQESVGCLKDVPATSVAAAHSNSSRKRKNEVRNRESKMKTLFKRKRTCSESSKESKNSSMKSESDSEDKGLDAEDEEE